MKQREQSERMFIKVEFAKTYDTVEVFDLNDGMLQFSPQMEVLDYGMCFDSHCNSSCELQPIR